MATGEPSPSASDNETITLSTPSTSPKLDAATPGVTTARKLTPTSDSLISISLTDRSSESHGSTYSVDRTSKDRASYVLKRASSLDVLYNDAHVAEDSIEPTVDGEDYFEEEALERRSSLTQSNSMRYSQASKSRMRSDSVSSEASMQVDWETLDKSEQTQDQEDDEQTTLLLARLEQENNAIVTNPKSGVKTRGRGQSRPPSVTHIQSLVEERGAHAVRFSMLPAAAPMTELDFWSALVRDFPQTAQRLPTITSNKIRCGIPSPLRGVVWMSMSGARDRAIEERFDRLVTEQSPYDGIIGKDVGRSFPQHEMFRDPNGEGQRMLGRVLKCYSLYDDKIGYCQGLGFLVGPLLMNMGDKEAFCVLVRLMEDYDLRACFLPDLSGLHLRIYQFNQLLRQHVPKVATHLENLGVEGEYLSQWFLSFFAVTCPLPLLFRIYDVIFAEGASETTMRVALAVMKRNERKILGYSEFEDIMQLLLSRQLWDVYGLSSQSADTFVMDFVGLTSLVTRESLNVLEFNFKEAQHGAGGRQSFLPNVSQAASGFLGRLWSSNKQQTLSPGHANQGQSRPPSTLFRNPSKQSLSTIASMQESDSTNSVASTATTEVSMLSREGSVDGLSLKSPDMVSPSSRHKHGQPVVKDREVDNQIEDLLTVLSEMQKNQALLSAQLQRMHEERSEDQVIMRNLIEKVRSETAIVPSRQSSHRRAVSEMARDFVPERKLSVETVSLLDSLEARLAKRNSRGSHQIETKDELRQTLATVREQLHIEVTRNQDVSRQLEAKEQSISSLREDLNQARIRIKDGHFDKQRLEKTIMELRQAQRQNSDPPSRSSSKGRSRDASSRLSDPESRDSDGKGGLRELKLGRGPVRTNSNGPTPLFSKRTSSLMHFTSPNGSASSPRAQPFSPSFTPPSSGTHDNDSLMLELASFKTSEALARQELEEMRSRYDAMRRMMATAGAGIGNGSTSPNLSNTPSPQQQQPQLDTVGLDILASIARSQSRTPDSATATTPTPVSAASSIGGLASGFFGWGRK